MGSRLPAEFAPLIIMREMGWTYQQLMEQPAELVDHLIMLLNAEAGLARERARAAKRKR